MNFLICNAPAVIGRIDISYKTIIGFCLPYDLLLIYSDRLEAEVLQKRYCTCAASFS